MSIQAEQEFKALLSPQAAQRLQAHYTFAAPFTQTNRYFDTPTQQLRRLGCGLRTRRFADHGEQTLKVPAGANRRLLEFTDAIAGNDLVAGGQVAAKIAALGVDWQALRPFAEATTTRRLANHAAGLLTLDQTHYPDGAGDWEVELEYQDAAAAQKFWQALQQLLGVVFAAPQNKIQRAKDHAQAK